MIKRESVQLLKTQRIILMGLSLLNHNSINLKSLFMFFFNVFMSFYLVCYNLVSALGYYFKILHISPNKNFQRFYFHIY